MGGVHTWIDGRCQHCGRWQAERELPQLCMGEWPNISLEDVARGRMGASEDDRQRAITMLVAERDDAMRRLARALAG